MCGNALELINFPVGCRCNTPLNHHFDFPAPSCDKVITNVCTNPPVLTVLFIAPLYASMDTKLCFANDSAFDLDFEDFNLSYFDGICDTTVRHLDQGTGKIAFSKKFIIKQASSHIH